MSKQLLRTKAEQLRDMGYSYPMIAAQLNISRSTLSSWLRDRPYVPNKSVVKRIKYGPIKSAEIRHKARIESINKYRREGIAEIGTISERDLFMLGIGLYIGEGSKSTDIIRFVNSNPETIKLAMKWFRSLGLDNINFSARLHLYPDNNEQACIEYWKDICGLKEKNFRKSHIDTRLNKKINNYKKLPYGTIHITILSAGNPDNGVRLFRKIQGWMMGAFR